MTTFTESGFRGFLSAFLPPLTSRDPAVAPQQRVILMGGLGAIIFNQTFKKWEFYDRKKLWPPPSPPTYKEVTDVTLACENGQPLEAHEVVLAVLNPCPKHPHPLIRARGLLRQKDI